MSKGHTIKYCADYLIPTYNTNIRLDHVMTFCNGVKWVDVWYVKATPGNEKESMAQSIAQDLEYYKTCMATGRKFPEYSIEPEPKYAIAGIKKIQRWMRKSNWYKEPDEALKQQIVEELNKMGCRTDINKAIYLERAAR